MAPKLTREQRDALNLGGGLVPVEDDQTHQIYFLVDQQTLDGLRENADRESVRQGIADLEAGRVVTLDELDARIQTRLHGPRPA